MGRGSVFSSIWWPALHMRLCFFMASNELPREVIIMFTLIKYVILSSDFLFHTWKFKTWTVFLVTLDTLLSICEFVYFSF